MANSIVQMQKTVPVDAYAFSAGTWTTTVNGTRKSVVKTAAADGQIFVTIPLGLDRPYGQYGVRLTELYIPYLLNTAAPTVGIAGLVFNRHNLENPTTGAGTSPSQTSVVTGWTLAFQAGQAASDGVTTSATAQAMIITPATPAWESEVAALTRSEYSFQFSFTPAATTAITLYPTIVRYDVMTA